MPYLLLHPYSEKVRKRLKDWKFGANRKNIQKYFIKKIGPAYLFEANGEILALALALKKRSGDNLAIYYVERLDTETLIPDEILKVTDKLVEKPNLIKDLEKLRRWKLWITPEWEER